MDQFRLWYFFEHTDLINFVDISKYKYVSDVQKEIHRQCTNTLGKNVAYANLALLKVNVEYLFHFNAGTLHEWRTPDDTETLDPRQRICDVWSSEPEHHYLHICVGTKRPARSSYTVPIKPRKPNKLVAALGLQRLLWGNGLDEKLQSLGGLRYLPADEVTRLGLWHLGYPEESLLFRQEYSAAYESLDLGSLASGKPNVVAIGQPGIGKSGFLYYLLLQRISHKKPTALQLSTHLVVFKDTGAVVYTVHDAWSWNKATIPEGTLALIDCALLRAEQDGNARIVRVTSLPRVSWKKWHKEKQASVYVMDHFSFDEIKALGNILRLNVGELLRIYTTWGPSAYNCVRFSRERSLEDTHKSRVDAAVLGLVKDCRATQRELDGLTCSNPLLSIQPKSKSSGGRGVPISQVATRHIDNLILKATIEVDAAQRIRFYRSLSAEPFRSCASYMLKTCVLAWLSSSPISTPIPSTAVSGTMADILPTLEIPVCSEGQSIALTDLSSLRNVPPPFCLLAVPQQCAPVDAIICTDEVIVTVQVVVSRRQRHRNRAKPRDFKRIRQQLSLLFGESRQWCHVIVTVDEGNAEALRYEPKEDLPADLNLTIFTAVFDLGRLSLIRERLDELIEESEHAMRESLVLDDDSDVVMD